MISCSIKINLKNDYYNLCISCQIEEYKDIFIFITLKDLKIYHLDVKINFLNRDLDKKIYIIISNSFLSPKNCGMVYLLFKAFYRLRQALRSQYNKIDGILDILKLINSSTNYNMYVLKQNRNFFIFLLYIDDLFIRDGNGKIQQIQFKFMDEFEISNL